MPYLTIGNLLNGRTYHQVRMRYLQLINHQAIQDKEADCVEQPSNSDTIVDPCNNSTNEVFTDVQEVSLISLLLIIQLYN